MRTWIPIALASLLLGSSLPAAAHSLKDLETELHAQERYAQFVDAKAADFRLIDLDGQPVSLASLDGKVIVLNFVYARCKDVCPLHMTLIARLQTMIKAAGIQEKVQFITIATDSEDAKATREVMATYARQYGLESANWKFLYRRDTEPADTTMRIAGAYGLKFTPAGDGMQMHGLVTHVVDRTGQLRGRFHGLRFDPISLVSYVNALVNDDHNQSGGRL